MIGLAIVLAGAALLVVALIVLFGPWAAVACGVALIAAGLLIPWEELTSAESPPAPPGR